MRNIQAVLASLLLCAASAATAAVYELRPLSGRNVVATSGASHISWLDSGSGPQVQTRAGNLRSEDLLWMVIYGRGSAAHAQLLPTSNKAVYVDDGNIDRARIQGLKRSPPAQDSDGKAWAVLLLGAALAWFQLRRNSRQDAMGFREH